MKTVLQARDSTPFAADQERVERLAGATVL